MKRLLFLTTALAMLFSKVAYGRVELSEKYSDDPEVVSAAVQRLLKEQVYEEAAVLQARFLLLKEREIEGAITAIAETYDKEGKFKDAEKMHQNRIAFREVMNGPTHSTVAVALRHLQDFYKDHELKDKAWQVDARRAAIWQKYDRLKCDGGEFFGKKWDVYEKPNGINYASYNGVLTILVTGGMKDSAGVNWFQIAALDGAEKGWVRIDVCSTVVSSIPHSAGKR